MGGGGGTWVKMKDEDGQKNKGQQPVNIHV